MNIDINKDTGAMTLRSHREVKEGTLFHLRAAVEDTIMSNNLEADVGEEGLITEEEDSLGEIPLVVAAVVVPQTDRDSN